MTHLIELMTPNQAMFRDLNTHHQHVVVGACMQAIREIEGVDPDVAALKKDFGRVIHEHGRFMEFVWKGKVIIRVYGVEIVRNTKKQLIQRRKIEQVWKKKIGSV